MERLFPGIIHFVVLSGNHKSEEDGQAELDKAFRNHNATFVWTKKFFEIPKAGAGVDKDKLVSVIENFDAEMSKWPSDANDDLYIDGELIDINWWRKQDLAVGIGVAPVHRIAQEARIPSVGVGDFIFSQVFRGCMDKADIPISSEIEAAFKRIESCERKAEEVYLLEFLAPPEYDEFFNCHDIKPKRVGLLWTGIPTSDDPKTWGERQTMRKAIEEDLKEKEYRYPENLKVARVEAGKTGVWKPIFEELKALLIGERDDPALITTEGDNLVFLQGGGEILKRASKEFKRLSVDQSRPFASKVLYAASDLGVSRGGVSTAAFIASCTPVALTEEEYHWLSLRQREEIEKEGLCFEISLAAFRGSPVGCVRNLLAKPEVTTMSKKMRAKGRGAEGKLAEDLCSKYLGLTE